ncbi:MAG TPA: LytTR family DNA-binding domain-containing protein [Ferruginibacter sp.]|nr:LytTR family DNA-binding domain-containing protein [Ferruginibacter sp.]
MNSIKTIIIDDEPRGLSSLEKLLQMNCPEVEVIAACKSAEEALEKIRLLSPQLVFLDIAMPGKSGFDMLNNIENIHFEIIFVTAHSNYMTQAFHFSAVDYLLKPVEDQQLVEAVKRAGKRIQEKHPGQLIETLLHNVQQQRSSQEMKICLYSIKGFQVIDLKNILYCEASSNYTNFHLTSGTFICTAKSIHEFEEILEDCDFIRIHKSFLINLFHVKEYVRGEGGSVILSNGKEVEISRRKREEFLKKMKIFYKY